MIDFIIKLAFLVATMMILFGLRKLSSPDTAKGGNLLAGYGMGLAIFASLFVPFNGQEVGIPHNILWIIGGLIVGSAIGLVSAKKVKMTGMPQLVSIFNGLGGASAVILAMAEVLLFLKGKSLGQGEWGTILFNVFIGSVAFTGSILAYAKLEGQKWTQKITFKGHNIFNYVVLAIIIGLIGYILFIGKDVPAIYLYILLIISLIYGVSFVAPIGGADMPVVISLLNSFTGLTAAAAGLIYGNNVMLVGGILVGASGTILTILMCNAMNRTLWSVIFGSFGGGGGASSGQDGDQVAKVVSSNDAAINLFYSDSVMIVPGYGLAVAQAQKVCKELDDLLTANGVDVKYAIHPVAGRMPGHMNVLLAEADVPYSKLIDLDDANDLFPNTDVVIVIGANDVVNPAAQDDPSSPIYGMPVLEVWKAKNVIVIKRSMSPGYAGIQNQLFFNDNTKMLFGDGKDIMQNLVTEVKEM